MVSSYDDNTLSKIADDYISNENIIKDWRYYIIKYDSMRDGHFGMYYWKNNNSKEEKPYEIIMMKTEKSISGYNWELFSYCLKNRNPDNLEMGNYSYNNEDLQIIGKDIYIYIRNSSVIFKKNNEVLETIAIPQNENGIDTVDRIEFIEEQIKSYL